MPLAELVAGGEQEPLGWLGPISSRLLEQGGKLDLLRRDGHHFGKKKKKVLPLEGSAVSPGWVGGLDICRQGHQQCLLHLS